MSKDLERISMEMNTTLNSTKEILRGMSKSISDINDSALQQQPNGDKISQVSVDYMLHAQRYTENINNVLVPIQKKVREIRTIAYTMDCNLKTTLHATLKE